MLIGPSDTVASPTRFAQLVEAIVSYIPDLIFDLACRLPLPGTMRTIREYHRVTYELSCRLVEEARDGGGQSFLDHLSESPSCSFRHLSPYVYLSQAFGSHSGGSRGGSSDPFAYHPYSRRGYCGNSAIFIASLRWLNYPIPGQHIGIHIAQACTKERSSERTAQGNPAGQCESPERAQLRRSTTVECRNQCEAALGLTMD